MNRLGIVLICVLINFGSKALAELSNETVIVTSKVTFVLSTNPPSVFSKMVSVDTNLVLNGQGKSFKIPWFGLPLKGGGDLQSNQEYTFSVLIHHETAPENLFKYSWNEIIRIEQNGQRLYAHDICELHEVKMILKELPISYGLPSFNYISAKRKSFPHGSDHDDGGCSVGPDSPKTSKVYRCSACEKAFKLWKK